MKPNTIEVIPEAISATIDVLWGTQAVGVAARTYDIIEHLVREQYEKGAAEGYNEGFNGATALKEFGKVVSPLPPEDLYGDDMWDYMWPPQPTQSVRLGNEECTIQHDSGDEQPEYEYPEWCDCIGCGVSLG